MIDDRFTDSSGFEEVESEMSEVFRMINTPPE